MSPPPGPPTEQPLADVVAAARDLSDLAQKLQYGQRVKVIWLRCTSNPLRPSQGPPRAPAYGWRTIVR